MRIAIVDSGVDADHPIFMDKKIKGKALQVNEGQLCISDNFDDNFGHGTAVTGIIAKEAPQADILVIKAFDSNVGPDCDSLVIILQYICDYIDCDMINLSLGVSQIDDPTPLENICKKIVDKGIIIVCAYENAGAMSYPAAFPFTIGVTSGRYCTTVHNYEYVDDNIINICAYGKVQRIAWLEKSYISMGGNSFACAHISAVIANFLSENPDALLSAVFQYLRSSSIMIHTAQNGIFYSFQQNIDKAILFPFNKEMHSIIRFQKELPFKIVGVYDTKYTGNVGKRIEFILKNWEQSDLLIQGIQYINWDKFDTVILGHLDKLLCYPKIEKEINEFLDLAIRNKKFIYVFGEEIAKKILKRNYKNYYFPIVESRDLPSNRFGKLWRNGKPVIGVFGTSSAQGKFTLQILLRFKLISMGYKVGQIGTEPQSSLFGIDCVYPMGYGSSVKINSIDAIRYLNSMMHNLCESKPDIIIVGSQSGTVPYDFGNIEQYSLPQIEFLLGTLPDVVCLCVNSFDPIEYIQRTIQFIESISKSCVIALILYPMGILDNWRSLYAAKRPHNEEELTYFKSRLTQAFHLPVYILGIDDDMNMLTQKIIDFFCDDEFQEDLN